jgi:autoaggregation protein RapA/B/C
LIALAFLLLPMAGSAATINATQLADARGHAQVDPTTGRVYAQAGFMGNGFGYYASVADYRTNTGFTAMPLAPTGPFGSYYGAHGGVVLARPDSNTATITAYDGTTGAQITSATYADHCGTNGACGFDWGGYSAMNLLQDQTGLYLLGRLAATDDWQLSRIDTNLVLTPLTTFAHVNGHDGYGIMIGGTLFIGNDFGSPDIDFAYNTLTGTAYDPDIVLNAGSYRASSFYDAASDTLFMANNSSGTDVWAVSNAASAFGVAAAVPLPAAGWLLLAGLGGMAALRRRSRAEAA